MIILSLIISSSAYAQKYEELSLTPPMGWNSWNTFQCNVSEKLVMETADIIASSGMKEAGYAYVVIDDCWMLKERDPKTGDLVADPAKFPHGMKALADYVHSKGLKFGLYNCAGTKTCAGYPGTRGFEYQDARYYASLGIDYLKFDWCNTEGINGEEAYTTMSKALRAASRPIVFSLCDWGTNKPWRWASHVGQLWRTTGDIGPYFDRGKTKEGWEPNSVMRNLDLNDTLNQYAGPGHWNDPDMLEVGNGMTESEDRTHFSIWCMMASPLIAGNDLRSMSPATKSILTNKEVIAIDQDSLGVQGFRYSNQDSLQTWFKPLKDGGWALCFLNRSLKVQKISYDWKTQVITDPVSHRQLDPASSVFKIFNLWTKKEQGNTSKELNAELPAHDVLMLRLTK
jgi:alpha-galactosidase